MRLRRTWIRPVVCGLALAVPSPAAAEERSPEPWPHPVTPIVVGGFAVGALGIAAGAVLHGAASAAGSVADQLLAKLHEHEVRCAPASPLRACSDLLALREEHDRLANTGTALLIGGGVVVAGTAVYVIASHMRAPIRAASEKAAVQVVPAAGSQGGGLWLRGRF